MKSLIPKKVLICSIIIALVFSTSVNSLNEQSSTNSQNEAEPYKPLYADWGTSTYLFKLDWDGLCKEGSSQSPINIIHRATERSSKI